LPIFYIYVVKYNVKSTIKVNLIYFLFLTKYSYIPACFGHKMTIFMGRPNIKENFIV
jgi:hypothetical protein